MIGLEGGWGSGKTTVVRMVTAEIKTRMTHVFTFDAWAHEGDPLRRTYLESLIKDLQQADWVDKAAWGARLETLANRRKESTTKSIPKPTTLGKCVAFSTLFVPLGATLVSKSFEKGLTLLPSLHLPISWPALVGFPLAVAPSLVIAAAWVRRKITSSTKPSPDSHDTDEFAFLEGKSITTTTQNSFETAEPTWIEFESCFCELMKEALSANSDRFLVIVIDNLDRVNAKDALTIWSTLQTFLQYRSQNSNGWTPQVSILVSYDPRGLHMLWGERDIENSFVDKSFQLRFQVPPLLLSNWRAYLMTLLRLALPDHTEEDFLSVYKVLSVCFAGEEPPTPRGLKLCVNQIGTLHRQWQHEFPLAHLACYAALQRLSHDLRIDLLAGKHPNESIASLFPPGQLTNSLAGLTFNVHAEQGVQLLLANPIFSAFIQDQPIALRELSTNHGSNFWAVLESVALMRMGDLQPSQVTTIARCLEASELSDSKHPAISSVIGRLRSKLVRITSWEPLDEQRCRGLSAACRLCGDRGTSFAIVESLRETIGGANDTHGAAVAADLIRPLLDIVNVVSVLGFKDLFANPLHIPVDAKAWLARAAQVLEYDKEFADLFRLALSFEHFREAFVDGIEADEMPWIVPATTLAMQYFDDRDWSSVVERIELAISEAHKPTILSLPELIQVMVLIIDDHFEAARVSLERLVRTGVIDKCVSYSDSPRVTASALFVLLFVDPDTMSQRPNSQHRPATENAFASNDAALADTLLALLAKTDRWGLLANALRNAPAQILIESLRRHIDSALLGSSLKYPTSQQLVSDWRILNSLLDYDQDGKQLIRIVSLLSIDSSLAQAQMKESFTRLNADLYLAIHLADDNAAFQQWCRDGLGLLSQDDWKEEIETYGAAIKMALLFQKEHSPQRSVALQDALVDYAYDLIRGEAKVLPDQLFEQKENLFSLVSGRTLRRRVLDEVVARNSSHQDEFWRCFGEFLMVPADLTDPNLVGTLFSPLLRNYTRAGLNWLISVFGSDPHFLKRFDDTDVLDFKDRVREMLKSGNSFPEDIEKELIEIARLVGVDPKSI